jgi:hypothetical protein
MTRGFMVKDSKAIDRKRLNRLPFGVPSVKSPILLVFFSKKKYTLYEMPRE